MRSGLVLPGSSASVPRGVSLEMLQSSSDFNFDPPTIENSQNQRLCTGHPGVRDPQGLVQVRVVENVQRRVMISRSACDTLAIFLLKGASAQREKKASD